MRERGIKIQFTVTKELGDLVEKEIKNSYSTKATWFTKLITEYFEQKTKQDPQKKKLLDLKIK